MKIWKIILLIIAIAAIAAAFVVYFFIYSKPHRDYERAKPDLEIAAEDLYRAFIEDEQMAAETFNGKVLLIDGTLSGVEQVADDMVVLYFVFEEGMFGGEGVRCTMLVNHHEQALQMEAGLEIVVKGLCTGFTGTDVILEHCSFP
ncbi:MAG: hypothetical protein EA394_02715 [Bacteroidia bacterium]|nr:MAG: hypothetical protein EA394_02715 [Bacteroidia bacterium]